MSTNRDTIAQLLVDRGQQLFRGRRSVHEFTKVPAADKLLNDLKGYPHAFVLGCIMDRQMEATKAWLIPFRVAERLGDFRFSALEALSLETIKRLMMRPKPLHWLGPKMPIYFHAALKLIARKYSGDAARIWSDRPSSADLVYRFLEFRGVGPKIATMAANILARDFKIPLRDYYSIDVSADRHVQRVFLRLGLVTKYDSKSKEKEAVVYRARALSPEFPGLLDFPAFDIGRNWCRAHAPRCGQCYMNSVCPSRGIQR